MISMKFIIVGRNIEVTPGLRAAVEEKIGKLDKYFNPDTEVHVTLSVDHSGKGKHYPFGAGKQRYVCIH